ncbi:MAG TPA: type I 3-dehydroquinate dehydratase [Vicinamibacterales bacterium]|nr:type I 3-dehydroquinate dehydratase [Vicinamibacterales bacterium]
MSIRIVETVTADTTAELRRGREAAESRADVVELRIDGVRDLDLAAVLADRSAPVIVTCRPVWEGGRYDGVEPDRLRLLRRARALGAEFIDVEVRADWRSVAALDRSAAHGTAEPPNREAGEGLVLSFHDFAGVPADFETIAAGMARSGADVVKIAVTVDRLEQCDRLRRIGQSLRTGTVIGMGAAGAITRVAPQLFNSRWTYAGPLTGVGQFPASALRETYGVGRVTERAALYGVAGRPVMHSKSPDLHNAAFQHEGLDAVYVPLEAADFEDFLAFAAAFDLAGASITAPFKGDALAAAAGAGEAARATGAANTLTRAAEGWHAENTDPEGFLAPLAGVELGGMNAAIIGRGGASRGVAHALKASGAHVTVISRDDLPRASEAWDLLVHATPVGTAPDVSASVLAGMPIRARIVYDLVYTPRETRLMTDAAEAGARVIGGLPMLVEQACRQFEVWFDRPAPRDAYARAAAVLSPYEANDIRRVR